MENDLTLLHQKIDLLTNQVAFLTTQAEEQQRRQQSFDELKADMIPIGNHLIKLTIEELAEIGDEFQVEDLMYLLKRVLRNTNLIMEMFDRLEAFMGIADEAEILGKQVFNYVVEELNRLERDGYFGFAREGLKVAERVVTEFSEEDVEALGDNVVTILSTVRNMTQPEIMSLANNAVGVIQSDPEPDEISTWTLFRELNNPSVRRGLARMIKLLKTLDEQASTQN